MQGAVQRGHTAGRPSLFPSWRVGVLGVRRRTPCPQSSILSPAATSQRGDETHFLTCMTSKNFLLFARNYWRICPTEMRAQSTRKGDVGS